jgi:hypothetical protein
VKKESIPTPRMICGSATVSPKLSKSHESKVRLEVRLAKSQLSCKCLKLARTAYSRCFQFKTHCSDRHARTDLLAHPLEEGWVEMLWPLELLYGRAQSDVLLKLEILKLEIERALPAALITNDID